MNYSQEQINAFNAYIQRTNIFLTGPGGTGKTALIKYIQKDAYRKGFNIQVCALTGCAAVLLECKAKTLHSWAGIGLGNGSVEQLVNKIMKNRFLKNNWKDTDILIVDEVSMMSQKLFELLDAIGKTVRKCSKPFGGIHLIFSGDFYQLPPVGDRDDIESVRFCFESPLWFQTFLKENHIQLTKIFRQSDPIYQKILNQIREGKLKRSSNEALLNNVNRSIPENCIVRPTKLFPTRNKVDNVNITEMNKLKTDELEFKLKYHSDLEMTATELLKRRQFTREQIQTELLYLKGNLRCDEIVKLKIGSQVMCIVNIELENGATLCNGSQGVITRLSEQGLPVVRFGTASNGTTSNGTTSNGTTSNGTTSNGTTSNGTAFETTMGYHVWPSENIPGIGVSQLPLILAWALTIHKAQGATIDIAEVDAGSGIFECGQTYVALSRVKSLEGLYLTSFDASKIKVSRRVQEFYNSLPKPDAEQLSTVATTDVVVATTVDVVVATTVDVVAIPVVIATPILTHGTAVEELGFDAYTEL